MIRILESIISILNPPPYIELISSTSTYRPHITFSTAMCNMTVEQKNKESQAASSNQIYRWKEPSN